MTQATAFQQLTGIDHPSVLLIAGTADLCLS
jgi:hypothetical protein